VTDPATSTPNLRSRTRVVWIALAAAVVFGIAVVAAIALILAGPTGEESPTDADRIALADAACSRVTTPHFYQATIDGKTSYLLGTRHAGVPLSRFPAEVDAAFRGARVLIVESLLDDTAGMGRDAAPDAKPTSAPSVEEQLGDELWARYKKLAGPEVAARVNHRGPVAATAELMMLYEDSTRSIDRELQALARATHKQIIPLEVPAATGTGAHLTETYLGIASLKAALKEIPTRGMLRSFAREMLEWYCTGKPSKFGDSGRFDDITNARTRAWVDVVVAEITTGNAFVAVGVGHLEGGEVNLPDLLRRRGIRVADAP
jgi:uncharacterized protein YbaP (TraB family)